MTCDLLYTHLQTHVPISSKSSSEKRKQSRHVTWEARAWGGEERRHSHSCIQLNRQKSYKGRTGLRLWDRGFHPSPPHRQAWHFQAEALPAHTCMALISVGAAKGKRAGKFSLSTCLARKKERRHACARCMCTHTPPQKLPASLSRLCREAHRTFWHLPLY